MAVPLLASASEAGRIAFLASGKAYWQVWVADASGENARQVTRSAYEKYRVAWYPNGRRLLVTALDGALAEVDVETGAEQPLALGVTGVIDAVVSPAGDSVAYALGPGGKVDESEIWVAALDDGAKRRLTRLPGLQQRPAWSPSGEWVYFSSGKDARATDLWRASATSGAEEKLTSHGLFSLEVAAAPDGRLAYSGNQTGNYEIWVWQPDGAVAPRRLTDDPALDGAPTWGPGGRTIAFHSMRSGSSQIWRKPSDGGPAEQLTRHAGGARSPVWWIAREAAR